MMVGYALDSPSGTYRFYNPHTNAIILLNSVVWRDFHRFKDVSIDTLLLDLTPGGKTIADTFDDFSVHTDVDVLSPPSKPVPSTVSDSASLPTRRITRSMAAAAAEHVSTNVQNHTAPSFTVTGNTTPIRLTFDSEQPEPEPPNLHNIYTNEFVATNEKEGGIDSLVNTFLFHTSIQNDPGTPNTWKEAIESPECEFWIKSMTAEFNNFLSRDAWDFVPLKVNKIASEDCIAGIGTKNQEVSLFIKHETEIDNGFPILRDKV